MSQFRRGSAFYVRRLGHTMQHPIIQKYISELVRARYPYFTSETEVICGRVVLTASPNIDADDLRSLRLDLPADVQPSESPYWLLLIIAAFDAETFCEIQPRIRAASLATGKFSEVIRGWRLSLFREDGHRVMLVEATSPPKV